MAVLQECPACKIRCSLKRTECSRCGTQLPTKRAYWIRYSIPSSEGRIDKWERLGRVPHSIARSVHDRRVLAIREKRFQNNGPTLGEVWNSFELKAKLQSEGRYRNVVIYMRFFRNEWGESRLATSLTVQEVENARLKLLERGLARATVDKYCEAARGAWNYYRPKIPAPNPFSEIKYFNPDNKVLDFLSREEEERVLRVAEQKDRRLYEMLVVSIATGLRMKNVFHLRRDELNTEEKILIVTQKGGGKHVSYLTDPVVDLLSNIPRNGTPYFWVNPRTKNPYSTVRRAYISVLRAAGITRRFVWHGLRHTTGSRVVQAGYGIQAAKEILGHKSIKTTMRYAHLDPGYLRRAVESTTPTVVTKNVTEHSD